MIRGTYILSAIAACVVATTAAMAEAIVETRTLLKDGTVVIDTSEITTDVKGYRDVTPIKLYLKDGVVSKVELQPNRETPTIFQKIVDANLSQRWVGLSTKKASTAKVDAISGATISSKAIIANVQRAAKFELENGE
ncbi:MAG: FMN-binding protein [Rikenellaceae bacterium]